MRHRLLLCLVLLPAAVRAAEFVAPYVSSHKEDVALMLDLAGVGPGDYLIDLGSGDGRIVIDAALRGAMGHGVELDEALVREARRAARAAEVDDLVAFRHGDVFDADIGRASVVTLFLMPQVNVRLRPRLLAELAPGTRVVSNSFDMGDWEPDRRAQGRSAGGVMLWIVPARVAGTWSITVADAASASSTTFTLVLQQRFQQIEASLGRAGSPLHVLYTALAGERIAFIAGDGRDRYAFSGRVEGDRARGLVQVHGVSGTRVAHWEGRLLSGPQGRRSAPGSSTTAP